MLSRGPVDPATGRDRGVIVDPGLVPPLPMLTAVVPPAHQPVARIGDTVDLQGHDLDGTGREVLLVNDRFAIDATIAALPPPASGAEGLVQFALAPALAATLPVGVYRVSARLLRSGETTPRETNRFAMMLAPQMTNLPLNVTRDGSGTASFMIDFVPALRRPERRYSCWARTSTCRKASDRRSDSARASRSRTRPSARSSRRCASMASTAQSSTCPPRRPRADIPQPARGDHMNAPDRVATGASRTSACWTLNSRA